jgi:hypothetical protein
MGDAPARQVLARECLVRAIGVVRQQHLVARLQQRDIDQADRCQPARHQHRVAAAFERGQALLEREAGGRAVQAVGVAAAIEPGAATFGNSTLDPLATGTAGDSKPAGAV